MNSLKAFFLIPTALPTSLTVAVKVSSERLSTVNDAVSALILASQSDKTDEETLFAVGDDHYSVAQIAE